MAASQGLSRIASHYWKHEARKDSRGSLAGDTLILGFQPLELCENKIRLFGGQFVVSPRKRIQNVLILPEVYD